MADVSAGELRTTEATANTPAPWRQRRWLLLAVVVGAVALLGLLYWGMVRGPSTQVGKSVPLKGPVSGESAPAPSCVPSTAVSARHVARG